MSGLDSFDVGDVVVTSSGAWDVISVFRESRFGMLVTAQVERNGNVMTVDGGELAYDGFVMGHHRWLLVEPPDVPPDLTRADMRWLEGR